MSAAGSDAALYGCTFTKKKWIGIPHSPNFKSYFFGPVPGMARIVCGGLTRAIEFIDQQFFLNSALNY